MPALLIIRKQEKINYRGILGRRKKIDLFISGLKGTKNLLAALKTKQMKHLIIGDLHGKDCWQHIQFDNYDKMIFIGDYVDHWTISDRLIYMNLLKIMELKANRPEQIELLLGNCDV